MSFNKRASVSSKISSFSSTSSKSRSSKKTKVVPPRRVVPSKALSSISSNDGKSCSTGIITEKKIEKSKKVTKSELSIEKPLKSSIDYCKHRGDTHSSGNEVNNVVKDSDIETLVSISKPKVNGKTKSVKQYYKNENFKPSTESVRETNGLKKIYLDTITEVPESYSKDSLFRILDSEDGSENVENSLDDIKEFRQNNYFECHSADSRIKNRASATVLKDHKCVYRFYLNDRLFPVPLCTDHTKEIRCIECLLPMHSQVGSNDKINGTIQAKVTLGKKNQDAMILLPIKEPLIIHEKRKEQDVDNETVFFGLINLDKMGRSVFNPNLPGNSLALKYQKGFQEFESNDEYNYHDVDKTDVIVI